MIKTRWIIFIICMILLIWSGSGIILWKCIPATEPKGPGVFGDMFGAINSLFSGFALAGIIYTILLQREELSLQREELRLTREEMKRSADAQENSDKSFKNQVELMHLSNIMAAKASLINAYCLSLDNNSMIMVGEGAEKKGLYKERLHNKIYELEKLEEQIKEKEVK